MSYEPYSFGFSAISSFQQSGKGETDAKVHRAGLAEFGILEATSAAIIGAFGISFTNGLWGRAKTQEAKAVPVLIFSSKPGIKLLKPGGSLELQSFDDDYFQRLRAGDGATCDHFVKYFKQLLLIKLRSRLRTPQSVQAIEDLCQDTFARVFTKLREEGGIRNPASLGSFVNSVCNNVLLEYFRGIKRDVYLEDNPVDPPDKRINLDETLVTAQTQGHVKRILAQLPKKNQRILHALFIEEKDKDEVCREFGVNRDYLRVLLHRAKQSFRNALHKNDKDGS